MIPEEFVTFETALLLKEAGFPQEYCYKYYDSDGWLMAHPDECEGDGCAAPTQAQAMRWLRENDLVVLIDIEYYLHRLKDGYYRFNVSADADGLIRQSRYIYTTYEAVAEAGIQASAEYLIEKQNVCKKTKQRRIFTKCYSLEDAIALAGFIVGERGYEGVQNDSWRYCEDTIRIYFNDNSRHNRNFVYIGVNTCKLVVGKCKKDMRRNYSSKYIEKERVFREILKKVYPYDD